MASRQVRLDIPARMPDVQAEYGALMRTHLVYDLPTRLFHWLFAGSFIGAYLIASTVSEESASFPLHMLLGLGLCFLVVLRLVWGLVGTRNARFSSFALKPRDLLDYFRSIATGKGGKVWGGHNPASSWAAIIMLALAAGLGITGLAMTVGGDPEGLEEVHELLANAFLAVALLHIAGVALHTVRHRDGFPLSMVDGHKDLPDGRDTIPASRMAVGLTLLVLAGSFGVYIATHYTPASGKLELFGQTLQLAEVDERSAGNSAHRSHEAGERDEDDDDR